MKCLDDKGRLRVILENKFWAGLTENQPVTYIRELPDGVDALVLFVVPEARLQHVWDEVVKRCKCAKIPVGYVQKHTTIMIADIGGGHYIASTSWTVLLNALSTAAALAAETECHNNIAQLQGLCKTMDEEAFLPLRGDELTNLDMARRIINFSNLALEIVYKAESKGLCSRSKAAPYKYGSGTYIQIGEYKAWLGFDAFTWRHLEVSPIWVTFSPPAPIAEIREKLVSFRTAESPRCFDMNNRSYLWLAVPIYLYIGVEKHRIIEDAVRQIGELKAELDAPKPSGISFNSAQGHERDTNPEFDPDSQDEHIIGETILEVGAEGGSVTLFGNRNDAGQWRFWTQTDETTMNYLLDEEDLRGLGSLVNASESVCSLTDAIALLDKYPWHCMVPLQVHPEFLTVILSEVQKRGTPEDVASWNSHVKRL
jgi:hypothetical protein